MLRYCLFLITLFILSECLTKKAPKPNKGGQQRRKPPKEKNEPRKADQVQEEEEEKYEPRKANQEKHYAVEEENHFIAEKEKERHRLPSDADQRPPDGDHRGENGEHMPHPPPHNSRMLPGDENTPTDEEMNSTMHRGKPFEKRREQVDLKDLSDLLGVIQLGESLMSKQAAQGWVCETLKQLHTQIVVQAVLMKQSMDAEKKMVEIMKAGEELFEVLDESEMKSAINKRLYLNFVWEYCNMANN